MTDDPLDPKVQKLGIVTDLQSCVGCEACALHCKETKAGEPLSDFGRKGPIPIEPSSVWHNRVHSIEYSTNTGERFAYFPRSCLHCERPACEEVCPTGAVFKRSDDGIVIINENFCIGCNLCAWACPYGALEFNPSAGSMQKCDMCVDIIYDDDLPSSERMPVCISSCPVNARHFGDLNDPGSDVSKLVEKRGGYELMSELGYKPTSSYLPPDSLPPQIDQKNDIQAFLEPVSRAQEIVPIQKSSDPFLLRRFPGLREVPWPQILHSTLTGCGFGILIWMSFFAFFSAVEPNRMFGLASFGLALAIISLGTWTSIIGLSKPKLFWITFTQWKTNWGSRHAIMSLASILAAIVFAVGWVGFGDYGNFWRLISGLTVFFAMGAIVSTAMTYASIRTIRAWFNPHTIRVMICMGLWTGVVWFNMFAQLFGLHTPVIGIILIITGIATLIFKRKYWIFIDRSPTWVSPESAFGSWSSESAKVRATATTFENYIHHQLGPTSDRKQIEKLRRRSFLLYLLVPFCACTMPVEMDFWIRMPAAILASTSVIAGVLVERWLFFTEAKHTAMLYYGKQSS